jgi:glycosyltransferase involved in cell wall biosynthesis
MPTYNCGRFIGAAIDSVLRQTFDDWELVISDNGSTDDTREVVSSFKDPRIEYHQYSVTVPMIPNFNRCLELAKGEYVLFLCADDVLTENTLEALTRALDVHPTAGLAVSRQRQDIDSAGMKTGPLRTHPLGPGLVKSADVLAVQCRLWVTVGHPAQVLARRAATLECGGFDPVAEGGADNDLFSRICCTWDAVYVDGVTFLYRQHDQMAMRRYRSLNADVRSEHYVFTKLFQQSPTLRDNARLRRAYVRRLYPWFPRALECIKRGEIRSAVWILSRVATFEPIPWWLPYFVYKYVRRRILLMSAPLRTAFSARVGGRKVA